MRQLVLFSALHFRIEFGRHLPIIREEESKFYANLQCTQALRHATLRTFLTMG